MIYRITWLDRLRAAWRRTPTWVLDALFLAAVVFLAVALSGCFGPSVPDMPPAPPSRPVLEDPAPAPTALDAKRTELAQAKAVVTIKESELADLQLAPLRTSLRWAEGLATLGLLASIGLAAAALFWGLGFTWKIPAGLAVCFAAVLASALFVSAALTHVAWIIAGVGLLLAAAAVWAFRRHLSVTDAARTAWQMVPDAAPATHADALLDRLIGANRSTPPPKP